MKGSPQKEAGQNRVVARLVVDAVPGDAGFRDEFANGLDETIELGAAGYRASTARILAAGGFALLAFL